MSFTEVIIWPFAWLLMQFYLWFSNYGLALIFFTVVLKLIFLPFQMKSKRGMMRTAKLTPLVKEIEKKYPDDKQKQQEMTAKLYKDEGVSPMSGCIWTLIPFPILLMLYQIINKPLTSLMRIGAPALESIKNVITGMGMTIPTGAYAELKIAGIVSENFSAFKGISDKLVNLDFSFLGMNLNNIPSWQIWNFDWSNSKAWLPAVGLFLIPIISAALSWVSMKISNASNPAAAAQQGSMKTMNLIMPLTSLVIGYTLPAALGIYWIMNSLLGAIQDFALNKYYGKIIDAEDAERRARIKAQEEELERKRLETERKRELGETERNRNTSKRKLQAVEKSKEDERLAKERAEEKAARRAALGISNEPPASQVGKRRYARGRAYVEDRFENPEGAEEATRSAAELSRLDEELDREFDADENAKENVEE